MRKSGACLLAFLLAVLGLSVIAGHGAVRLGVSPAYLADGGGPMPPPIPMGSHAAKGVTYVADGGGPMPPPIPMKSQVTDSLPTYMADGGGPMPPPIPMKSQGTDSVPTYLADGGGPMPPPIPMRIA